MAQFTASTTLRNSTMLPSPGALDDAPVMHGDGRIDQVAAQRPQPRQNAVLVALRQAANSRPRRTPRSPRFFGFRPRRYVAATVSAVSGRPGKASGGHRKDARGMSIIGLSMAALPCCTEEDVEAGSAGPACRLAGLSTPCRA